MAKQYWIGGFYIDLSRNQITQNNNTQTLAPKALAVLTHLAENQGTVVSHDALLEKVWKDTIVSPNTLQRSIAQLRKALGDDGKGQVYIQTHAKQGYSLECDVRWHSETHSAESNDTQKHETDEAMETHKSKPSRMGLWLVSMLAGIMILGAAGYQYLAEKPTQPLAFDTLRSLTATDDKEFDASYSPDGRYVVFHRYLDKMCVNKIWAKNISTQQEILLTKEWGAYGRHSFSEDGKTLIFLATEACTEPVTQKSCYDLVSLDFEKALQSPQDPSLMLQCKNSAVKKPIWLGEDNIALLQKKTNRWKVINYSISENTSTDLYSREEGNVIDYAFSARDDLVAVVSIHDDGEQYIEMLKPDGHLISRHQIKLPQEIPKFRHVYPTFDPLNQQLVFSTGRQLFTLSYDGQVSKVNFPYADVMIQPEFHPDGKKLLLIKGPYDSDVVLLRLDQIAEAPLNPSESYSSFERTTQGEDHAKFQPGGESIAFWSRRSGDPQIWLSNGSNPQQLTDFPLDTYIGGFDWAADGQSLLVNVSSVLTQVFLNANQKTFPVEHPVVRLFQWDSQNNTALVLVRIKGIIKLAEYDLNNSELREITDKIVLWAHRSESGQLIYKDHLDQFWQPGPVEAQPIELLDKQGSRSKSFVMQGNVIYSINGEDQLWSYDLDDQSFEVLGTVAQDIDYVTDINQTQLLMTRQVSAKKEVIELSTSE